MMFTPSLPFFYIFQLLAVVLIAEDQRGHGGQYGGDRGRKDDAVHFEQRVHQEHHGNIDDALFQQGYDNGLPGFSRCLEIGRADLVKP